jgi:hypothetical protein
MRDNSAHPDLICRLVASCELRMDGFSEYHTELYSITISGGFIHDMRDRGRDSGIQQDFLKQQSKT